MSTQTEVITIDGMSCGHCVATVSNALENTDGVHVEEISIGAAKITHDASRAVRDRIRQSVEDAGFTVREMNAPDDAL